MCDRCELRHDLEMAFARGAALFHDKPLPLMPDYRIRARLQRMAVETPEPFYVIAIIDGFGREVLANDANTLGMAAYLTVAIAGCGTWDQLRRLMENH